MVNLSISLPERMKEYIDEQVELGDFADSSDFLRELVRRDQEKQIEALRAIVDDALQSGVSDRTTDEIFAEAVAIAKARGTYRE